MTPFKEFAILIDALAILIDAQHIRKCWAQ
jgi:hypothetical protein